MHLPNPLQADSHPEVVNFIFKTVMEHVTNLHAVLYRPVCLFLYHFNFCTCIGKASTQLYKERHLGFQK